MIIRAWLLGLLLSRVHPAVQETTPPKAKVEIVGLHINKAPPDEKEFTPNFGEPAPGTKVNVLVTLDQGEIVRFDESKSKLLKFTDDKGTDLLAAKAPKQSFFHRAIGSFPAIAKDRKACIVDLLAMTTPALGAKTLELEATLSFVVGGDQEVAKEEKVAAKKDTTFNVAGLEFKVTEAGKNTFGNHPMKISLQSKDGLKVAKFRFLDESGREIESHSGSRSSMSFGGMSSYSWDYTLKEMVPTVTVEVTLWKKVTTIELPIKSSLSAGF